MVEYSSRGRESEFVATTSGLVRISDIISVYYTGCAMHPVRSARGHPLIRWPVVRRSPIRRDAGRRPSRQPHFTGALPGPSAKRLFPAVPTDHFNPAAAAMAAIPAASVIRVTSSSAPVEGGVELERLRWRRSAPPDGGPPHDAWPPGHHRHPRPVMAPTLLACRHRSRRHATSTAPGTPPSSLVAPSCGFPDLASGEPGTFLPSTPRSAPPAERRSLRDHEHD